MQRIFLTHTVSKDMVLRYKLSMAACNFSHNLIDGGIFDKVYFVLPTFVRGKVKKFDGLVYSSLREHIILSRLAPVMENIRLFRQIPCRASIWYYNCNILNVPLIILLKLFKPSVKQQMIILDYTPSNRPMERFFLWLINHMDGTIRLADSPLFTVRNSVCLPGIVPANSLQYPLVTTVKKEFLISGALGDNIAMLPLLLDVFSQLPDFTLHITGKASDIDLIEKYTGKYSNIVYHGMVSYEEYLCILHEIPFLLSTRNPACLENQCNFPSKIIEALLHNRIVVSTLHYDQLEGIRYLEVPSDKKGLKMNLQKIVAMPQSQLLSYANQAEEVKVRFSCEIWRKNIIDIEKTTRNQ